MLIILLDYLFIQQLPVNMYQEINKSQWQCYTVGNLCHWSCVLQIHSKPNKSAPDIVY